MCGRFSRFTGQDAIINQFGVQKVRSPQLKSYNIAPSQEIPVIHRENPLVLESMRWGYIPFYAKSLSDTHTPINARDDSLHKNLYKHSLENRRILIPANGFYEWKKIQGFKQPFHIHLEDYNLFSFGGIYSTWKNDEGREYQSFAIITTEPNDMMRDIHDRMPLIIPNNDIEVWMDKNTQIDTIKEMIGPYQGELLADPVSTMVNSPKNDNEQCIDPISPDKYGSEHNQQSLDDFF